MAGACCLTIAEMETRLRRRILVSPGLGISVGALAAAATMAAAWDHNPQGEFHATGVIHWADWLFVGGSWFVVISLAASFVVYLALRSWAAIFGVRDHPPAG